MVEDKYIGLALAVSSSIAIGTSFIITKKASPKSVPRLAVFKADGVRVLGPNRCRRTKFFLCLRLR